jgi:hypothetical protein
MFGNSFCSSLLVLSYTSLLHSSSIDYMLILAWMLGGLSATVGAPKMFNECMAQERSERG